MRIEVESTEHGTPSTLTPAETLVLLDFLARFDRHGQPDIHDQAEQLLFWHSFGTLDRAIQKILPSDHPQIIAKAREAVRRSA